jgi:hypothetical protein
MSLLDDIKSDIEDFTSDEDGPTRSISFVAPTGETATINGLHTKHHFAHDTDGNPVNLKNAHISFSEGLLIAEDYPVRNSHGEVDLTSHKVTVKDSTGTENTYIIRQWFPNETIGLITCLLMDFE